MRSIRTVCNFRWPTQLLLTFIVGTVVWGHCGFAVAADGSPRPPVPTQAFLKQHCVDCHEGTEAEGGLDLTSISFDLSTPGVDQKWIRIWDRVESGEMPPADVDPPPAGERSTFVQQTRDWLRHDQLNRQAKLGRVQSRRLTRREIERSLQDLLGIDIPLANLLPEESLSKGFDTVADAQSMSHFQLERHLTAVDTALDEAIRRAMSPPDKYQRDFDAEGVARTNPKRRCREPEMRNGQAVVWSSGLIYYGRLPATTAPEDGWYRFKVTVSALKPPKSGGVWCTVNTGLCVSSAPLLTLVTTFEATPEPRTIEFEAWLPKRHMLEIRPGDVTLKRGRFEGGQVGVGEGEPQDLPGIAFDRVTMERVHHVATDDQVRQRLFGDLQIQADKKGRSVGVVSNDPQRDISQLLHSMARRAFRRPVADADLQGYVQLATQVYEEEQDMVAALRTGYRALLCSPRFLYLTENLGPLDSHAVAARLSYMLTGSMPDEELAALADADRLRDPDVIHQQTDRLLAGAGSRRFIEDFSSQWLELSEINFTEPDRKLYPTFDPIVQQGMLDETHTFLDTMLVNDSSVTDLISADHTFLNSRLARFYGIPDVAGDDLRRVELGPETHRGGVLTQGAILKITANGSNTSPVIRGVWVSERLLGVPIPPPPGSVPAIEPDIRGAKTIREQLAKHRSQPSCAGCHVKIDPPGFALENFDPAGQWRDHYTQIVGGRRSKGAKIDASYSLQDGREFTNVDDFRSLIVAKPERVAANVAEQLLVYGTGAPISFADRDAIDRIIEQTGNTGYGFRSIVDAVVTSPVFLSK